MFNGFLKKFNLKGVERELDDYLWKVTTGDVEQHGMILAHACLVYSQIIKKLSILEKVINTKEDIYGAEIAVLVLKTNSLLKEYNRDNDILNAAGVKLLNETLRCLAHPELTLQGKELWEYFSQSQDDAEKYLLNLEKKYQEERDDAMVSKIKEARRFISLVPARYKAD